MILFFMMTTLTKIRVILMIMSYMVIMVKNGNYYVDCLYNDNAVGLLVLVITKMMMAIMNMIMMIM